MADTVTLSCSEAGQGTPVVLLHGFPPILPTDKAKAMAAAISKASLTLIANVGHMPMLEQPEATTTAIRNFLSVPIFPG